MRKFLIVLLILLSISIPFAAAHPFTEKTIPSLTSNSPTGTTKVIVFFSESVDLGFSQLKVLDSNGDQIDNRDTDYHEGEDSLVVTTPPLKDGVYTVSTKVLSKIDGHLVPDTFVFTIGNAQYIPPKNSVQKGDTIFLPEAGSRFPGLVGQTIVLGAVIASMIIWGTQNKQLIRKELDKIEFAHHRKFMSITGIGLMLVFASNILMIIIQTIRLEASLIDAIQTSFGTTWIIRMSITASLLVIWFGLNRRKILSKKNQMPMLVAALALIGTSSMIGHGAASGETSALILDYIHNFVAAMWIGGIFYFVFTLLPIFSQLKESTREKVSLLLIPRFSIAFVISVGIIVITGPTLLWLLESDMGLITESIYGQLIILKISIAAIMIGMGGFVQIRIQKNAEKNLQSGKINVHKRLKRSLKVDVTLGIALLGVVALLVNGTLPAGEIHRAGAQEITYGLKTTEFTENVKFDIEISPFSSGINTIKVTTSDFEGKEIYDLDHIKVKVSNPSANIFAIQIPMSADLSEPDKYQGELTFGFSGEWQLEIEAQRTENANESVVMDLQVKPKLADIQTQIIEYELPKDAKPLFPLYDGRDSIWISDPSAPRLWQFSLETRNFSSHSFDGRTTTFLTQDNNGRIWFTDTLGDQIGFLDPDNNQITTRTIPKLDPVTSENTPISIQADYDGNIWITIPNKDKILKYMPESDTFEEIILPERQSLPFALTIDRDGNIWYSTSGTGKIGFINPENNQITLISGKAPLQAPEALIFDNDGDLWIAEHTGLAITKFNPVLETFDRVSVPDEEALPFGMTFDRYGNIWFAQHTVDNIGVYDPDNDDLMEIPIPTETSFVQFMASDGNDNVWFVEQQTNKIGTVMITEIPVIVPQIQTSDHKLRYAEIASPLIALGIIATSLFYIKSIQDKRRLNLLINS